MVRAVLALVVVVVAVGCGPAPAPDPLASAPPPPPPTAQPVEARIPRSLSLQERAIVEREIPADARRVLERPDSLEVMRIAPCGESLTSKRFPIHDRGLLGCEIRKSVAVAESARRSQVVAALYYGIGRPSPILACWAPHHGIRATANGVTVEIAICFDCGHLRGFVGREPFGAAISRDAQVYLDSIIGL